MTEAKMRAEHVLAWEPGPEDEAAVFHAQALARDVLELEAALREIAEQDPVELALDPQWPVRIARAALSAGGDTPPCHSEAEWEAMRAALEKALALAEEVREVTQWHAVHGSNGLDCVICVIEAALAAGVSPEERK